MKTIYEEKEETFAQIPPPDDEEQEVMQDSPPPSSSNNKIWFKQDENWELSWPIWHMLPRSERKALAQNYGYKSIGEFEEFMTLTRAVGDSSLDEIPYKNELAYPSSFASSSTSIPEEVQEHLNVKPKAKIKQTEEDVDSDDDKSYEQVHQGETFDPENLSEEEMLERAGYIVLLPEELLQYLMDYLPIEHYASAALVSPHWRYFTRTEAVYKRLCERIYLRQSMRKSLHVNRFGHSYRNMLYMRPRVRAGGGLYILKYVSVKKIHRDMWTEIPVGAVLETVYYRYLCFQEDGRVLYALTTSPPHEMIGRMKRMLLNRKLRDKAAVWGSYVVQKTSVEVTARQDWQYVKLQLTIQPQSPHGRFGALSFDRHSSSSSGCFDEDSAADIVEYEVPHQPFRFLKDRRL